MREFRRFVGNHVFAWFLLHPTSQSSINELARELTISPASVKRYTDILLRDGILSVYRIGTSHLFSLNNDDGVVQELKGACMMLLLREAGIASIAEKSMSLAVYGSAATGTFDERSDIDILVIGEDRDVAYDSIPEIESSVGHEFQITVIPYYRWEDLKKQGDTLVENIMNRHVLFHGAEL